MKKWYVPAVAACVALGVVLGLAARQARAINQFKKEFEAKYVKEDSEDPKEKAFAEAVAAARCYVCHGKGSKKNRNLYGQALSKLLSKDDDKDNKEKIQKALDEVAKEKSKPDDEKAPSFGDLIKEGKLPGGDPEDDGK